MSMYGRGLLPQVHTVEQFRLARHDEAVLGPAVTTICDRSDPSTNRVMVLPPVFHDAFATESRVLEVLDGRLPVPTPKAEAIGRRDGKRASRLPRL